MQHDDDTWAAVRRAYEDEAEATLSQIAARFGLTPMRIGAKAKQEGWAGRAERATKRKTRSTNAKPFPAPANRTREGGTLPTRGAQEALIGRLYRAISLKLEHMETRMASGDARSAQDEERESRALASLISNFEKVTEAVAGLDKDNARAAGTAGADAERMRREIAERLERLGGSGPARKPSRKPRS